MIIRIASTANVPGAEVISDLQRTYVIHPERRYVLHFTNGDVTLRAFKELFLLNKEVLFYVANFEFFLCKMSLFKHCRFEFVRYPDDTRDERVENYRNIEKRLGGKYTSRGVELSFAPDVFASIRSSLLNPELYLSKGNLSTVIYKELTRRLGYEDLKRLAKDAVGTSKEEEAFDEDFDKHLKSLVFTGLVKMKDGLFHRWSC